MKKWKNNYFLIIITSISLLNILSLTSLYSSTPDMVTIRWTCGGNDDKCVKGVSCSCVGPNGQVTIEYGNCRSHCVNSQTGAILGSDCTCDGTITAPPIEPAM
jgi:hypothetical protein